jgi:hypothetical protein
MSTCNRFDLQTLGSQPIMSKNLPVHWCKVAWWVPGWKKQWNHLHSSLQSIQFTDHRREKWYFYYFTTHDKYFFLHSLQHSVVAPCPHDHLETGTVTENATATIIIFLLLWHTNDTRVNFTGSVTICKSLYSHFVSSLRFGNELCVCVCVCVFVCF